VTTYAQTSGGLSPKTHTQEIKGSGAPLSATKTNLILSPGQCLYTLTGELWVTDQ
jgi:hypothetical protein